MSDLRGFSKSIKLRGEAVVKNTDALVRRVALLIDSAVVLATPVKTGRARANWLVAVGEAPSGTVGEPSSPGAGAQDALDNARAVIGGYAGEGEIHITNNLPYIEALNAGSSQQAPAAFVEIAIEQGVQAVRNAGHLTDPDTTDEAA
jgi:hypothetical protein